MRKLATLFAGTFMVGILSLFATSANAWWGGWNDGYYGPWGGGPWYGGYPYGGYGYPYGGYGYPYGGYGYPYGGYGYPYGGWGYPSYGGWGYPGWRAPTVVQPQAPSSEEK
jgi:hypothetical protein